MRQVLWLRAQLSLVSRLVEKNLAVETMKKYPPDGQKEVVTRGRWWGIVLAAFCFSLAGASAKSTDATPTQLRQFTITDEKTGLEWLRCTVGQRWNGFRCIGVAKMMSWDQAQQAAASASKELGGEWRLPSVDELQTLLCTDCPPPKIDQRLFPDTPAAPFWTYSKAPLSIGRYWTVNFFTGHLFARNTTGMERYVRLVKSAPPRQTKQAP